jgi:parvulin-like peptidyl-prolyl isomerase
MKRALIGSLFVAVLVSSAPAFAQSSDVAQPNAYGPRTRAEVKAELIAAQKSGELDIIRSETYPQLLPYQTARVGHNASSTDTAVMQANDTRVSTQ